MGKTAPESLWRNYDDATVEPAYRVEAMKPLAGKSTGEHDTRGPRNVRLFGIPLWLQFRRPRIGDRMPVRECCVPTAPRLHVALQLRCTVANPLPERHRSPRRRQAMLPFAGWKPARGGHCR